MHGLFLGEEAALNRLSFVTVPSDHSGPFLNKQGLTATVAGGICVEFNIVKQHRKGSLVDSALKAAVSHAFVRPPLATGGGRTIAGLDSRSPGVVSARTIYFLFSNMRLYQLTLLCLCVLFRQA